MVSRDDFLELKELKAKARELVREAKEAKLMYERKEAEIFSRMEETGFSSVKLDGENYVAKRTVYARIQDSEKFYEWCKFNECTDLYFTEKEEKGRLNELVREAIDNGYELPPGLSWYPKEYVAITENQ